MRAQALVGAGTGSMMSTDDLLDSDRISTSEGASGGEALAAHGDGSGRRPAVGLPNVFDPDIIPPSDGSPADGMLP
jgi:hypothetical protein